jgi:hypothetical protein
MADNLNFSWGNTFNLGNSGAVAGTVASFTTTAATNAVVNGKFTTPLGVQTNAALPAVDSATGLAFVPLTPNQCCTLVFGVSSAGVLQLVQGKVIGCNVGNQYIPGSLLNDPQFPGLPNDFCPIAYTIVKTSPLTPTWTPGVSSWTGAGVVFSPFQNVSQLPNRPQAS